MSRTSAGDLFTEICIGVTKFVFTPRCPRNIARCMVLKILYATVSAVPERLWVHIVIWTLAISTVRAFIQGRTTNRERDLHGRVILVTGGFTPFGLTLLEALAKRGAKIIALSSDPITSPTVLTFVELLRSVTSNEHIYADECDLESPASVKAFCMRFMAGEDERLDALVLAHEYRTVVSLLSREDGRLKEARETASLATFLLITLLLPALLVAPPERDIRIVNVINPFYAAAVHGFWPANDSNTPKRPVSLFVTEGTRSLRMAIFIRHLQRVLDALPS